MPVELISSRTEFSELRENWNEVYAADKEARFFLSWSWLEQLYQRRAEDIFILAYRESSDASRYSAFLPLRKEIRFSQSRMRLFNAFAMAGNYWADYTGVICETRVEESAIAALADYLSALHWYRLQLECLRMSPARMQLFMQPFESDDYLIRHKSLTDNGGKTQLNICPYVNLPDSFENYLETRLSVNMRQKIRRYLRRLDGDRTLELRLSTVDTREEDLARFHQYWLSMWRASKGKRADRLADNYIEIIRSGLSSGDIRMPVLLDSGRPVAMLILYLDWQKNIVLFFASARDRQFTKIPAGLVLHASSIEWAISNNFHCYDLLRGDERYKSSLGAVFHEISNKVVYRNRPENESKFLDYSCHAQAMELVSNLQESSDKKLTHRLYSQLLESWPGDAEVLQRYANWLHQNNENEHASSIESFLVEKNQTLLTSDNPINIDKTRS